VSADSSKPEPYRVVYSGRVRQRLLDMADVARSRSDGGDFLAALKEFDRRLRIYPQFGEQLVDLKQELGQVWIGFVRPLSMRYSVFENARIVNVGLYPVLLPRTKS
jgi:hypothetical protein